VHIAAQSKPGFTIIETTATLAVIAILSAIVVPRASGFIDAIEVRGAVTEVEALFSTARHVAIARGAQTVLDIDVSRGMMSLRVGADTLQRRELERAHGVVLRTTRASITYSPTGVGYGAANLTLTVTRNASADTIYVSRLGRVRH
jgi:prepilin-type N-terminal cleavage/methylation domain-containing protein